MAAEIRRVAEVDRLKARLRGTVLEPGLPGHEEARRVWNGAIDRRPALIARCVVADDVAIAIRFARDNDLTISVRGGGHGVSGTAVAEDGLMIDLSGMDSVEVDPDARVARAGPGTLWGGFAPHASRSEPLRRCYPRTRPRRPQSENRTGRAVCRGYGQRRWQCRSGSACFVKPGLRSAVRFSNRHAANRRQAFVLGPPAAPLDRGGGRLSLASRPSFGFLLPSSVSTGS